MPRLETTQCDFTAGEWSPLMHANSDLPRYQRACTNMENWIALQQRGARRRWGTLYTAEVKDSARRGRLMGFRYSETQSYLIEFGHLTARFYSQNTRIEDPPGTPVEIATPWTEAQLPDLEWAQYGDTALIAHPNRVPYRLVRVSNLLWKLQAAPFIVWPSAEIGINPATTLTLSAASGAITATSGAAAFLAADVGRQILGDIGEATITGYTSTTQVNATAVGFLGTAFAAGEWTITESPKTTLTLTAITNKKNGAATLTLGAAGWRTSDVGSYVLCEDGQIEITAYSSTTVVTGRVRDLLKSGTAAGDVVESGAWSLEPRSWSASRGYPRAVALAEQRSLWGGTAAEPTVEWASAVGFPFDLSRGVRAASGFALRFWGSDMSTIMHLVPTPTTVLALTASAEMTAGTGSDDAMTPSNVRPRQGATSGASRVRPVLVNNDCLYVQDGGTRVRALAYNLQENALWSPDISWESEHLFRGGVVDQLVYSKDPHPTLYAVLNDGRLAACALYRQTGALEHEILAWSPQVTDGVIESAATMRYNDEDQLWLIVRRTINGATKRYIERAVWTLNVDCGISGTSGSPTSTWTGLDHLEGKTVDVLGDGAELLPQVVVAGAIETKQASDGLPRLCTNLTVGLHYDSTLELPDIEPMGNSFGAARVRANEVIVDMYDTIGIEIQGSDMAWREFGPDAFASPPVAFSGKKGDANMGWDGGRVRIRQVHPFKAHIRSIVRKYTVNEG